MLVVPTKTYSRALIGVIEEIRDHVLPDGCQFSKQHLTDTIREIEYLNERIRVLEERIESTRRAEGLVP